ncbi:hypothetical protein GCM10022223_15010 [Kineosporia mesophila]|uniref:Protein-S-isoprenylcysteine O-methyltransferase Ste14 n=1 Tax=Kineosporia mesophila TaxID=566012 RepID=A0ABP6ZA25_9ACTN|nr:isoprenylcysteine carboxylmethyltransferase family protein [Kineosporia mesophila]MCD5352977.1 isoprenylcysteine carboxylmethyltransferase family protein [Kineosporia mesophila]
MSDPALLLVLLGFVALLGITQKFFRRTDATRGAAWWQTAAPFLLAPVVLIVARILGLSPITPDSWVKATGLVAVVPAAVSLALMFWTLGTHRIRIALFHQQDDAPQTLVTEGVYSQIRHPFYTSYILLFLAVVAVFPHWLTLALLIYLTVNLTLTAGREERRLSASQFGEQYQQYMARTGRFFPRSLRSHT